MIRFKRVWMSERHRSYRSLQQYLIQRTVYFVQIERKFSTNIRVARFFMVNKIILPDIEASV